MAQTPANVPQNLSTRQKMLRLLRAEPIDDIIVSPLIESDYACFIKGSKWPSDVSGFDDYLRADEATGCDTTFETMLDYGKYDPELKPVVKVLARDEHAIRREVIWHTPHGDIRIVNEEKVGLVPFTIEGGIDSKASFPILEWYFGKMAKCTDGIRQDVQATMKKIGERGIARVQAGNNFELSFAKYPELLFMYMDDPKAHLAMMDVFWEAQKVILETAMKAGADMVYASGVAAEMMSPKMFEETFLPTLKRQREFVHQHGKHFYYHSCGHTKRFIELGFYNEILPDVFETLSPPPPGLITDLRAIRKILDPRICTKGNLHTEILRSGSLDEIAEGARKIVDATRGYRHIVALADSVLWGTPIQNIKHFVQTAKEHYRKSLPA